MSEDKKLLPSSEIDLQYLLTDSLWGTAEIGSIRRLLSELRYKAVEVDQDGNLKKVQITEESNYWNLLEFFTRDLRLGNLDPRELFLVRYDIELSTDLLVMGLKKSFVVCLSRPACVLETSQSKGGFLRRLLQSIFKHEYKETSELGGEGGFKNILRFGKQKRRQEGG